MNESAISSAILKPGSRIGLISRIESLTGYLHLSSKSGGRKR